MISRQKQKDTETDRETNTVRDDGHSSRTGSATFYKHSRTNVWVISKLNRLTKSTMRIKGEDRRRRKLVSVIPPTSLVQRSTSEQWPMPSSSAGAGKLACHLSVCIFADVFRQTVVITEICFV